MTTNALDSQSTQQSVADLQTSASGAAALASATTKDSYEVSIDGLDLILNKDYSFVFRYLLQNADPDDKTQNFGPFSPRVYIPASQVYAALPDNRTTPTNVSFLAGFNSYQVKWDKPTFPGYVDTIVWESPNNTFDSSSTVVYIGTSNQINILTSNTDSRYIKIIHRDKILHADVDPAKDSKFVIKGPITPKDPIIIDTVGPSNVSGVSITGGIDTTGYLGFNGYANVSWSAVTDGDIRGYRIRFKPTTSSIYSYADSPGTATSYKLTGLAVGVTYNIEVATYDQYNNTSTSYIAGSNISIPGTPSMSGYITAGAFKFGDGVVSGKRGLYFNASNYWYIDSNSTASFKIGGLTSNYISWDGSTLSIDGNIGASGTATIGGNINLSTSGASIYNGTINSNGNLTGNGFALNSTGLKVANGTNAVTLDASTGTITANAGSIAGWTLSGTTLSKNNISLDSAGQIRVGSTASASVYLDATNNNQRGTTGVYYKMWAGNNNPSLANFSVDSNGVLRATNAEISGSISVGSTLSDGTSFSDIKTGAATGSTALQPNGTLTGNVSGTVGGVAVATVTSGASKGNSAVQPGNGVTVDSTTKIINGIQASNGMKISSGGTRPVYMDNTGLYMTNAATGLYSIFLDASNGDAVFRGTIYAAAGEFTGKITSTSGSIGGFTLDSTGFSSPTYSWSLSSNGTLSGGTSNYLYYGYVNVGGGTNTNNDRLYVTGKSTIDGSLDLTGNIKAQGTVYVGPSFNAIILRGDGTLYANTLGTGSGLAIHQVQSGTTAGYLKVNTSTIKHKENIEYINSNGYLDKVSSVAPVLFNYKQGYGDTTRREIGLIAEDLEKLGGFNEVLHYNDKAELMGISYDKLTAHIILAIKEIKDRLDAITG